MQRSLLTRSCILAIAILASAQNVLAWGKAGHEVVGIIAENNLTDEARAKINHIMDKQSLAAASLWPDQIKFVKGWTHTRTYHYMSIDDGSNYYEALEHLTEAQRKYSDIVRSLLKAEDILRDDWSSKLDKANAIRFLVHFIGDLHQPLHIGRYEDTGGNAIKLKWFNAQTNLHSIWDNSIIKTFVDRAENMLKFNSTFLDVFNPLNSPVEIAAVQTGGNEIYPLLPTANPEEIRQWQSSYIMTWLEESLEMRNDVYYKHTGSSESYYQRNYKAVNIRLLQAGYRLAAWLNALMSNEEFKEIEATQMREKMVQILGPNYTKQTVLVNTAGLEDKTNTGGEFSLMHNHDEDEASHNPLFDHDCNH
jgi:hypothetical protein